jgi:hypothetical protein
MLQKGVDTLPSGKILLRLPRTLHGQLIEQAQREGTSLNRFLVYVITSNTSAQLVATAVADKLASASNAGLRSMASLTGQGLTTLAAANMSAQYFASAMTIIGDTPHGSGQYVASGTADRILIMGGDVVTYGTSSGSKRIASFREKSFDPLKRGRVRVHG